MVVRLLRQRFSASEAHLCLQCTPGVFLGLLPLLGSCMWVTTPRFYDGAGDWEPDPAFTADMDNF